MKVAVVQHDQAEPGGIFDELFETGAVDIGAVKLNETNEIPAWVRGAALVLMGGPMSANDEDEYPWLLEEKALVRDAVQAGRPVLGVCLGAQLIASALGARVYRSVPELGWQTLAGLPGNPIFPAAFPAFELHAETFDLPAGGRLIATGEAVPNQAFTWGSALGVQFHVEATAAMIADWTADVEASERERIAADTGRYGEEARRLSDLVLAHVLRP
jgi:GMP synthase-like glutamine amidotransferase